MSKPSQHFLSQEFCHRVKFLTDMISYCIQLQSFCGQMHIHFADHTITALNVTVVRPSESRVCWRGIERVSAARGRAHVSVRQRTVSLPWTVAPPSTQGARFTHGKVSEKRWGRGKVGVDNDSVSENIYFTFLQLRTVLVQRNMPGGSQWYVTSMGVESLKIVNWI